MKVPLQRVLECADEFFMKSSPLHESVRRIASALDRLGVPFAVAGALAANAHGHVRTTADVDILVTREGLQRFKDRWLGRGWVEKFPGSRGLRDAVTNVPIDILLAGDYPGDGLPKPVCFPDPATVAVPDETGWPVLPLKTLVELKLASGMTAPHRIQDLADVLNLIRVNGLPEEYAEELDPYVRSKFRELWRASLQADDF